MNSSEEYFVASFAVMHQQIKLINHVLEELSMRLEEIEEVIDEDLLSGYVFSADDDGEEEEPIHEGFEPVQGLYDDPSNAPNTYESEKGEFGFADGYRSTTQQTSTNTKQFINIPELPEGFAMMGNDDEIFYDSMFKRDMNPHKKGELFTLDHDGVPAHYPLKPGETFEFFGKPPLWTSGMGDGYAHTRKKGAPKDYRMD